MGDVLSLVEEVQRKVDHEKAERLVKKLKKGKDFDLADFRDQLEQMGKHGRYGRADGQAAGHGPGAGGHVKNQVNDKEMEQLVAIINSMTPRSGPSRPSSRASRKRRIAMGSGTQVQDVNRLLKQFTQMQKMMKKMKGGGMAQDDARPGRPFARWLSRLSRRGNAARGVSNVELRS